MQKILIVGSSGALGSDAIKFFQEKSFKTLTPSVSILDITKFNEVENYFSYNSDIDLILHCAAYTQVDKAESDVFNAYLVNHYGTLNIATLAKKYKIPLIYISTDYVFDGIKNSPYLIEDLPNPLNIYGKSKLAGEEVVQLICEKFYVVRTSWLYGLTGKNFVSTIINLSSIKKEINVVDDQIGCPTFTYDLLKGIYKLILNQSNYGIYHICSAGETSWYGFAKLILSLIDANSDVLPIKTELFNSIAKRPKYSVMYNYNSCEDWQEGLVKYFKLKNFKV